MNDKNNISILLEFVAIEQFIDDNSESSFPLKQLENIYIEKMHTLNQYVSSHTTTRFAQKIEVADIKLKNHTIGQHIQVYGCKNYTS